MKNMQELAEALGISRTTVSLVLKGKGDQYRISSQTQKKILALAEEKQFKPNFFAQALNRNRTKTIGVIFPDVFEEFMIEMIRGIEDVLAPEGYIMILMTSRFKMRNEKKNLESLLYRGIDGVLLVPTCHFQGEENNHSHIKSFDRSKTSLVMIDRFPDFWEGPCVIQNDRFGGQYAAKFLQSAHCGQYLAVSLDLDASTIRMRLKGFQDLLPGVDSILLKEQNPASRDLEEALKHLVTTKPPEKSSPLGIFVTTSGLALRVKEILGTHGFTLNKEFLIIRFGSDPKGYSSGMASIPQPHYNMGHQGAQLLLELIEKGQKGRNTIQILDLPL